MILLVYCLCTPLQSVVDIDDIKQEWKKALSEVLQKDLNESKYILEAIEAGTCWFFFFTGDT